jgi:hypothetical protein
MTPRLSGPRPATVELGGFGKDASRLRWSPTAALNLRNAIDASLKMSEQPQRAPAKLDRCALL